MNLAHIWLLIGKDLFDFPDREKNIEIEKYKIVVN